MALKLIFSYSHVTRSYSLILTVLLPRQSYIFVSYEPSALASFPPTCSCLLLIQIPLSLLTGSCGLLPHRQYITAIGVTARNYLLICTQTRVCTMIVLLLLSSFHSIYSGVYIIYFVYTPEYSCWSSSDFGVASRRVEVEHDF